MKILHLKLLVVASLLAAAQPSWAQFGGAPGGGPPLTPPVIPPVAGPLPGLGPTIGPPTMPTPPLQLDHLIRLRSNPGLWRRGVSLRSSQGMIGLTPEELSLIAGPKIIDRGPGPWPLGTIIDHHAWRKTSIRQRWRR